MRYNSGGEEPLHNKASLYQVVQQQRHELQNAIRGLSEQQLKSTPADQLVATLAERYSINIPVLDDSNPTPSRAEVDIDQSGNRMMRPFGDGPTKVKGTEITISVPYTGDAEIFRIHAGNHTMNYPLGRIGKDTVTFSQRGTNLDPARVRQEFDGWIAAIKQHLDGMRKELGSFNDAIKSEISSAINARLEKLNRDDDLLSGLGFGGPKKPQQ